MTNLQVPILIYNLDDVNGNVPSHDIESCKQEHLQTTLRGQNRNAIKRHGERIHINVGHDLSDCFLDCFLIQGIWTHLD